jgi:hypothetical protein
MMISRSGAASIDGAVAEDMANSVDQIGAVQGIKMEIGHPLAVQLAALFGGDRGGDQFAGFGIVAEAIEQCRHPGRHRGAAHGGEARRLFKIGNRQDARHDGRDNAGAGGNIAEPEIGFGIKKICAIARLAPAPI